MYRECILIFDVLTGNIHPGRPPSSTKVSYILCFSIYLSSDMIMFLECIYFNLKTSFTYHQLGRDTKKRAFTNKQMAIVQINLCIRISGFTLLA